MSVKPNFDFEKEHYPKIVAGIDESGRGSLIGPVIAAAVILNPKYEITGINDSKLLSASKRERLYDKIISNHIYAIGVGTLLEIEEFNILNATKLACMRALNKLSKEAEIALVDGNMKFSDARCISIVKGDQKSLSIAAASIIAKVERDKIAREMDLEFPYYNWSNNKGYATKQHKEIISKYGISKHHRRSFCHV